VLKKYRGEILIGNQIAEGRFGDKVTLGLEKGKEDKQV
jgi:hypothetical protein